MLVRAQKQENVRLVQEGWKAAGEYFKIASDERLVTAKGYGTFTGKTFAHEHAPPGNRGCRLCGGNSVFLFRHSLRSRY